MPAGRHGRCAQGGGIARHFQADVETLFHAEIALRVGQRGRAHVDRAGDAQFGRQFQPVRIHVGNHHEARARMSRHRRSHEADGTSAGDQHVFTQHGERERGVDRVAERIENAGDLEIHMRRVHPEIAHGHRDALGEGAGTIHAYAAGVSTQVTAARQAVPAVAAHDVALAADDLSGKKSETFDPTWAIFRRIHAQ